MSEENPEEKEGKSLGGGLIKEYIEVPPELHSYEMEGKFDHCMVCDKYLLEDGTQYLVEKAIKKYTGTKAFDVVFEYAICMDCAMRMHKSMSEITLIRLSEYFGKIDFAQRRQLLIDKHGLDSKPWMSHCIIKGTPVEELSEYQICGLCDGSDLLLAHMPYLISGEALDEISELISAKTREELDDFIDQHFGLPPEIKDLIKDKDVVLV